jgi:beta-lactamase regulating signal transducer with metallopeptidase domain
MHMVLASIFWFYPLVWWLGKRLVEERERACDEGVLELGSARHVYAESILKTCTFGAGSRLACISGVTGADLKRRIASS